MGDSSYERLAAQDSSFVKFEGAGIHVHVSAVIRFDAGPQPFDLERTRAHVVSRLHTIAHSRQHLAFTPIQNHPIWVDDPGFDVSYHVRHVALPGPGGESQLRELAGQLISQPLDMTRPLWELHFIEGCEDGGFAAVAKIHHCMIDGVSGVSVMMALFDTKPTTKISAAPAWKPQPAPSALRFLTDGVREGTRLGWSSLRTLGESLQSPFEAVDSLLDVASAGLETLRSGFTPPGDTPFNRPIGTQRRVDWRSLDLTDVRDVKKRLDGSVNDVLLTVVSGAMRRFLRARRVKLKGLDLRVIVPVDTRTGDEHQGLGNRVSAWFISLPITSHKPRVRFQKISQQTRRMKDSRAERGVDGFLRFADWAGSTQLTFWGVNLVNWMRPYNLIVTNIHGPHFPLYLLGAPLRTFVPQLPLFENQGLAIAALSYLGQIHIGLSADRDLVPDLERLGDAIEESFAELKQAAESP